MNQKNINPQLKVLQGAKPEGNVDQKSPRRKSIERGVAVTALVATVGVLGSHIIRSNSEPANPDKSPAPATRYTEAQLNSFPQDEVTIPTGGGALNAVEDADPTIAATDPTTTQQLEDYVNNQAPNRASNPGDTLLQAGQHVHVPVLPPKPTH